MQIFIFWCNEKFYSLSHHLKLHLLSYNIFTVNKQQSFWFVADKIWSKKTDFNKLVKESAKKWRP